MRKYQPDTSKSAGAEAKTKKINEAYETLKDSARRATYDLLRKKSSGHGSAPPPPKTEAQAGSGCSSNLFATSSGALRVWLILAFSFVGTALFFYYIESDPLWFADALGCALVSFGIAYAAAQRSTHSPR